MVKMMKASQQEKSQTATVDHGPGQEGSTVAD